MVRKNTLVLTALAVGTLIGSANASIVQYLTNANFTSINGTSCAVPAGCTLTMINNVNLGGGNVGDGGTETITVNNSGPTSPIDGFPSTAYMTITEGGNTAVLAFENPADPQSALASGVPDGISYDFLRISNTGSTLTIPTFTLQLVITDQSEGNATGSFAGQGCFISVSAPGVCNPGGVTGNSTVGQTNDQIYWTQPPSLSNQVTPATTFTINAVTQLVAPSSLGGESTIQGTLISVIPEPATTLLAGSTLLALGFLSRRRLGKRR